MQNSLEPFSKQLIIVVGLLVMGVMAFGLSLSVYRTFLFENMLHDLQKGNEELRGEIEQGYRDLAYFQSVQYKDKYAKEHLNKLQAGEKVLILNKKKTDPILNPQDEEERKEQRRAVYEEVLRQMPVIEHWKLYLFKPKQIEALQQGL